MSEKTDSRDKSGTIRPISNSGVSAEGHEQGYGDLTELNQDGVILKSIGRQHLKSFADEYLQLLGTSSAIYEANGDYAFGIFTSGWCRMMDSASRNLCDTPNNAEALSSGRWLCHESCWSNCSKRTIAECTPVDIACNGGLRMYAVPILAHGDVVGAMNFGYGDPPTDPETLCRHAKTYHLDYDDLVRAAEAYESRPPFIIELAKKRLHATARLIGSMVETKKAEEGLLESEETLRTTLQSIGDGVISTDMDGLVVAMNPVAESLTGWSEKGAMGKPLESVFRIINEQTRQPVENPVTNVLKSGRIVGLANHTLLVARDGREIPIADSGAPIRNDAGEITGVVLVFRDQTEERAAQEALESNYAMLQIAGETAKFGGWAVDLEKSICTWSDAVADIHEMPRGYAPQLQEGISFYAPEWREKITEVFTECAEKGVPYDEEMEIITQKGKRVWVRTTGRAVKVENGKIRIVQGSFQDISEHKEMEEEQRKDREHIDHILRATRTNMNTLDSEFNLLQVDEAWQKVYGDPQGRKCHEYFMGLDKPCAGCGVPRALETREIVVTEEFLPKEDRYIEVHTVPFQDENGEWLVTEFNIDITERKLAAAEKEELQAQLLRAQKMESVGRLAGGVAHDFNNMLGVILGNVEMAMEQVEPGRQVFEDLQEIRMAAERSVELTRQLLAFARKQTIAPRIIDLNETVEGMLTMLRRLIGEDIDLAWMPRTNSAPVKVDPSQVDQILANLCVNARDAIDGVGKLTIETARVSFDEEYCAHHVGFIPGEFIMLAVSDNGCGMDQETMNHLFEPFFTTKDVGKGTGLGLASVYGVVKQNNGFINLYSEPGQGTTFKIYLPRHQAVTTLQADKTTAKSTSTAGGSETILLVEDEPAILHTTRMMLERMGYVVIPAVTPGEAIRLACEHSTPIDLLMTDVVMPEMNGRDLAKNLLSIYPDIKRLFMSGYTANVIAHHGVLDEGVCFLQKPFASTDLREKLREIFEKKNAD